MKKVILSIFGTLTLGLASCDMDLKPYDAIPESEALSTVTDYKNLRVGLYSALRSITSGSYLIVPELQCDNFNAVVGYSNTNGDMYRWQFNAQSSDISSIYENLQSTIARANFILTNQDQLDVATLESEYDDVDEYKADSAMVKTVIGEAYFVRAFGLYQLAQYFCPAYDQATASKANSGVSFSLVYNPTSDASKYPGRKTLEETYAQIAQDIASAKTLVNVPGEVLSSYITSDLITAFEARVALSKKDYATAAAKAVEVINTGNYALCEGADAIEIMWHLDGNAETIFQIPVPSLDELPGQNGRRFIPYQEGSVPDYLPTAKFLSLFADNDTRIQAYFDAINITTTNGAAGQAIIFNKYADRSGVWEALGQEKARFTSEPKPFRLAEMYLIAAEAYAQTGDVNSAQKYLNDLKKTRYENYVAIQFPSVNSLMLELKDERNRELACEGFRLFDLKRWNEDVVRGEPQNMDFCLFPGSDITTNLSRSAGDFRMVWPIPKSEMDANPQMMQNYGY